MFTANRRLSQFYHVLHRLLVPRHPPNALTSLTTETVEPRNITARGSPADGQVITPSSSWFSRCSTARAHARTFIRRPIDACSISLDFSRCSTINHLQNANALLLTSSSSALVCEELIRASHFVHLFSCQRNPALGWQWARKDLNFRPHAYQACALTS